MIQLLGRDVLLHPIEQPSLSKGGKLHLPDAYKKRPVKGIVILKGPACKYNEITTGDVVLVNAYSGTKVSLLNEGSFWIVQEDDFECKLLAEPKIRLVDTETLLRLMRECAGELAQKLHRNTKVTPSEVAEEYELMIRNRINDLTLNEGFEF